MTLQQLRYIIAAAETGSITEAAKVLYIAQPSLSGAIKEVEKEVGFTIFPMMPFRYCINERRNGISWLCKAGYSANGAFGSKIHKKSAKKTKVLCIHSALHFYNKRIC